MIQNIPKQSTLFPEQGFTLLLSTTLIGSGLLLAALAASTVARSTYSQYISRYEYKQAKLITLSCLDRARLNIAQGISPLFTLEIANSRCTVQNHTYGSDTYVLRIESTVNQYKEVADVTINGSTLQIITKNIIK